jgi:hypothetical protein
MTNSHDIVAFFLMKQEGLPRTKINEFECKGTGAEYETHETENVKKKIIRITQSLLAIDLNM